MVKLTSNVLEIQGAYKLLEDFAKPYFHNTGLCFSR